MECGIIGLACDHAGFDTKEIVVGYLLSLGYAIKDYGAYSADSVDYPDYAHALANGLEAGECCLGMAFCGSANGISMTLNKHQQIRAAVCWNEEIARLAKQHNNANVCSIPARYVNAVEVMAIVDSFLNTEFENGRHAVRVDKIAIK